MPGGNKKGLRIIIAGGGTGGHLFPGIAIAESFIARDPTNRVLFVNTGKPFEKAVLKKLGMDQKQITATGFKGQNLLKKAFSLGKVPKGLIEAIHIIHDFKPHIVLGIGSYASGAMVLGARLMGAKIVLHEQNIRPGMANRLLSPLAHRIYVSFEQTAIRWAGKRVRVTGNPVRKSIRPDASRIDRTRDRFTILVAGGSQGAHAINTAVMGALEELEEKALYRFIHQTGTVDRAEVEAGYRENGVDAVVQPFFDDMAAQYNAADFVICRAGATTVAEITALGKPALFVPYPFAADDHQTLNARTLEEKGAAEMIHQENLTGMLLSQRIDFYRRYPDRLEQIGRRAMGLGRPEAAGDIVEDCYELVSRSGV